MKNQIKLLLPIAILLILTGCGNNQKHSNTSVSNDTDTYMECNAFEVLDDGTEVCIY